MDTQLSKDQIIGQIGADAQNVIVGKDISQTIIGGDVEAGQDFVGRDKVTTQTINTQVVNIYNQQATPLPTKYVGMKLILDRAFNEYTAKDQERLLQAIRQILEADINITGIEQAA